jgi:hypothetical protein
MWLEREEYDCEPLKCAVCGSKKVVGLIYTPDTGWNPMAEILRGRRLR